MVIQPLTSGNIRQTAMQGTSVSSDEGGLIQPLTTGNIRPLVTTTPKPTQQPLPTQAPQQQPNNIFGGIESAFGNVASTIEKGAGIAGNAIQNEAQNVFGKANVNNAENIIKQDFPQTTQAVQSLMNDFWSTNQPKSPIPQDLVNEIQQGITPQNIQKTLGDMWTVIKPTVTAEQQNITNLFSAKNPTDIAKEGLQTIVGAGNVVFSPITTLFNAAGSVPVLGTVTRLLTIPFAVAGDAGALYGAHVLDQMHLPANVSNQLKPGVKAMYSLGAQIAVGEIAGAAGMKEVKDNLTQKFGADDAQTIIDQAQRMAKSQNQELVQRVVTGKATPEEIQTYQTLAKAGRLREFTQAGHAGFIPQQTGVIEPLTTQSIRETQPIIGVRQDGTTGPLLETPSTTETNSQASNEPTTHNTEEIPNNSLEPATEKPPAQAVEKQPVVRVPAEMKGPVEQQAFDKITTDPNGIVKEYTDKFGNEVNPDLALQLFDGYKGYNSGQLSRASGAVKQMVYNKLLQTEQGKKNNTVLISAGGSGSGKSSVVGKDVQTKKAYSIVVDTTLSNKSAPDDVKKALKNGYDVHVAYVLRLPQEAWANGVLPRTNSEGRVISEGYFLKSHVDARKNIVALYDKYQDNPHVGFSFFVNKPEGINETNIDTVRSLTYNKPALADYIKTATDNAYEKGQLTKSQYQATKSDRSELDRYAAQPERGEERGITKSQEPVYTQEVADAIDLVREALYTGDEKAAQALHNDFSATYDNFPTFENLLADNEKLYLDNMVELATYKKELVEEGITNNPDDPNNQLYKIAQQLQDHFSRPKAKFKITGSERTYTSKDGHTLIAGGNASAAFDRLIHATDIEGFKKNIQILHEKFDKVFTDIYNNIRSGAIDGANYETFRKNFENLEGKRLNRLSVNGKVSKDTGNQTANESIQNTTGRTAIQGSDNTETTQNTENSRGINRNAERSENGEVTNRQSASSQSGRGEQSINSRNESGSTIGNQREGNRTGGNEGVDTAKLRDETLKYEDLAREAQDNGKDYSALRKKENNLRDQLNDIRYTQATTDVVLPQPNNVNAYVEIQTFKYSDGKYAYHVSANTNTSGFGSPFSDTLYDTKDQAIRAGAKEVNGWVIKQTPDNAKQKQILTKIKEKIAPYLKNNENNPPSSPNTIEENTSKPDIGEPENYINPEKGSVSFDAQLNMNPVFREFFQQDIEPGIEAVRAAGREWNEVINPPKASQKAAHAANLIREAKAHIANYQTNTNNQFKSFRRWFDRYSDRQNVANIAHYERTGTFAKEPTLSPADQGRFGVSTYSELYKKSMMESYKVLLGAYGKTPEDFIENYVRRQFVFGSRADEAKGTTYLSNYMRSLSANKSPMKQRVLDMPIDEALQNMKDRDIKVKMAASNPEELRQWSLVNAQRALAYRSAWKDAEKSELVKFIDAGASIPEGFVRLDDPVATMFGNPHIPIEEHLDENIMNGLNEVAKNLGITHDRLVKVGGRRLGYTSQGGPVVTKFATSEAVLAHEIGHQIDFKYGLQEKLVNNPQTKKELRNLADQRLGESYTPGFKSYTRKGTEKMAAVLESYIHAPKLLQRIAPNTYRIFNNILKNDPKLEPLTQIQPGLRTVEGNQTIYAGGAVIRGRYYADPSVARVFNNAIARGLEGSATYRGIRYISNSLNQFQLGLSGFHFAAVGLDAGVTKTAIGISYILQGHPVKGTGFLMQGVVPFGGFFEDMYRGNKLIIDLKNNSPEAYDILQNYINPSGTRLSQEERYTTGAWNKFSKAIVNGNPIGAIIKGAWRLPSALVEGVGHPLLGYAIPRVKLGAFMDLAELKLSRLGPQATEFERRQALVSAATSIDNRMGQLIYDNLFWNKVGKDVAMLSVRSVGWDVGTLRELGGAVLDVPNNILLGRGQPFDTTKILGRRGITDRLMWGAALVMTVALYSAIYQYLHTGQEPQELVDYFHPKNGLTDKNGNPDRVNFASYLKDVFAYASNPVQTTFDKASPIISAIEELLTNKDYYGNLIRNPQDPAGTQIAQVGNYLLQAMFPFTVQQTINQAQEGASIERLIEGFFGIVKAPQQVIQSGAYQKAIQALNNQLGMPGPKTPEQIATQNLKTKARAEIKAANGDWTKSPTFQELMQNGTLNTLRSRRAFVKGAMETNIQRITAHLPKAERRAILQMQNSNSQPSLANRQQTQPLMQHVQSVQAPNIKILKQGQQNIITPDNNVRQLNAQATNAKNAANRTTIKVPARNTDYFETLTPQQANLRFQENAKRGLAKPLKGIGNLETGTT